MSRFTLTVPLPPTTNHIYRATKAGRVYMTKEARRYKTSVGLMARAKHWDYPAGARLAVGLVLHFPHGKQHLDLDNRLKLLLDSCAAALGLNDSALDELHVMRGVSVPKDASHAIITIEAITEEAA